MLSAREQYVSFQSAGLELTGIVHNAESKTDVALVMLVGGPQYRVGSHRMYVKMAREFAAHGIPVLRFDFSGMGDSGGEFPGFEDLDQDISSACDFALEHLVSAKRLVLFGLCDGASAAAIYAQTDDRVAGLVLLNPWVHTEQGEAKAFVWYYYPRRLLQRDFWRSLISGQVNVGRSLTDLFRKVGRALSFGATSQNNPQHFIDRMRDSLQKSSQPLLTILSENDLTAKEYSQLVQRDARWREIHNAASKLMINNADHTLSSHASLHDACGAIAEFAKKAGGQELRTTPTGNK